MEQVTCPVDDCGRPIRAKGLCGSHYNQTYHPNRHAAKVVLPCSVCGEPCEKIASTGRSRQPVCGYACRAVLRRGYGCNRPPETPPPSAPVDRRSPLRRAYEEEDWPALLEAIRADTVPRDGCWLWSRTLKKGYAYLMVGSHAKYVHRLSVEAKHGAKLGSQPVHHLCANTACVNPAHLEPVTHAANTAEMLARRALLDRIEELEQALAALDPTHNLLQRLPLL